MLYRFAAATPQIQEMSHTTMIGTIKRVHTIINPMTIINAPPNTLVYSNPIGPKITQNTSAIATLLNGRVGKVLCCESINTSVPLYLI